MPGAAVPGAAVPRCTDKSVRFGPRALQQASTGRPGGTFSSMFTRPVTGLFVDNFSFTPQNVDGTARSLKCRSQRRAGQFLFRAMERQGLSFNPENGQSTFNFEATVLASSRRILNRSGPHRRLVST